jgi:1-acyl-sn-glycerol-3-phosphate acyltransferase
VDQQGHAAAPLRQALAVLRGGKVLGIFPEGARSADGRLLPGKAGVSLLMLKAGVPLVPAAIVGAKEALPKGRPYPLPHRITVRYGAPIRVTPPAAADRRGFLQSTTSDVMNAIGRLLAD